MPRPSNRERLLDCAEELFASHGVGGVSMRTIQSAAGLSVGSLRYHFKSEAALVAAVMERRLEPIMERHEKQLEVVRSKPAPSTGDVLNALIRPLVELLISEPERGQRYLTLMHRLQLGHYTAPVFLARWPEFAENTRGLFEQSLPHLTNATLELRFGLAWETLLGSLARAGELAPQDLEDHVDELIDYLSGALEAPQTTKHRRDVQER